MNYLQKNKFKYNRRQWGKRNYSKNLLSILAVFVAMAIMFSLFDNLIIRVVSPLWRVETGLSRNIGRSLGYFRSKSALIYENEMLKSRVTVLESAHIELSLKESEVENLQGLLGRRIDHESIIATILTRPPQSPYDLVVVDAGSKDSVVVGAKVTLPEGSPIGTVVDVFPAFSKVRLYSTSGEKTPAVLERYQMPVILEGAGGGNFKIVVPREMEVVVGDRVLSSTLNSSLVAVVESIEVSPTDAFKKVLAKGPANIFSIRYVTISNE